MGKTINNLGKESQEKFSDFMQLVPSFKKNVSDKSGQIDSNNEQDWYSLTLGWALGKGLSVSDAHDFARFIRYHSNL
jgi:hypothetical protein